jgi:hypothetical protein
LPERDSFKEIRGKINVKIICRNDLFSIIATIAMFFTREEE